MIEVKPPGGNDTEATVQLFTMLGSIVIMMRQMATNIKSKYARTIDSIPPCLGLTVVGHRWSLYVAFGKGNDASDQIVVMGPITDCACETSETVGVYKLLRLQECIKRWARMKFWPWYRRSVLEPIVGNPPLPPTEFYGDEDEDDDED